MHHQPPHGECPPWALAKISPYITINTDPPFRFWQWLVRLFVRRDEFPKRIC
jgi:hypothetical protein